MSFSGSIGLRWSDSTNEPNTGQIYNAVSPGGHYFLVQFSDGKWYDLKSNEITESFKYIELFDKEGKFLPDVHWTWVVDPEEGFSPYYSERDFPKGDKRTAWSFPCLVSSSNGQIRIGKYNYITREFVVLGEDQPAGVIAFCDIDGTF